MVRFCGMRALAHQQRHAHTRTDTDCDATPALDVDGNTIALYVKCHRSDCSHRHAAAASGRQQPDQMMHKRGAHGVTDT
jgi:hypothetical protein